MSARFLIIDGYNLMHAAGLAKARYGPKDLQRCREKLIQLLLKHLQADEIARATLVFDATQPPPDAVHEQFVQGLAVFFATSPGDADEFIERWLHHHHAPSHVTMISSDHRLHRAAKRHHALPIDSEQFVEELLRRKPSAGSNAKQLGAKPAVDPKTTRRLTTEEVDSWLTEFGDIPGADKLRSVLPTAIQDDLNETPTDCETVSKQPPIPASSTPPSKPSPTAASQPSSSVRQSAPRSKVDPEEERLLREAEECLRQEMEMR